MYAALFAFQSLPRSTAAPVRPGKQVPEFHALGQVEPGHHVLHVGAAPACLPTPYGLAVGSDAPGNLRPREPGLLLESLETLREVVGEVIGLYVVVNTLSRHWASPSGALRHQRGRPTSVGRPRTGIYAPGSDPGSHRLFAVTGHPIPADPCMRPLLRFRRLPLNHGHVCGLFFLPRPARYSVSSSTGPGWVLTLPAWAISRK